MQIRNNATTLAPTDLSNFLSCHHLSALDLEVARGNLERPTRYGAFIEALRQRGMAHEAAYLAHLRGQELDIVEIAGGGDERGNLGATIEATKAAMAAGADIIYQAVLTDGTWWGRADFLRKIDRPSDLGPWSYEAIDTKLARDTRAGTILQLCVYSLLLEKIQGVRPQRMYVVTPGNAFEPLSYRTDDYGAYFRLLIGNLDEFIRAPSDTYPELVNHCDYCAWWSRCEERRRGDDHLCYVAGISNSQIKSLREAGIDSLTALARLDDVPDPSHGSRETLIRTRDQARVQHIGKTRDARYYEFREPFDAEHGFAFLPKPTLDDLFLDFEGNHFAEHGPQEYLTGYVGRDESGEPYYRALWARTLEEERRAFETFMDTATAVRARNPGAHIYHFAAYEPAALKRLMGRFATREVELDELLRGGAFVDLHQVVKRALVASVERYSIKDLEPFFGYARKADLREARLSQRIVEHAIEFGEWDEALNADAQRVEDYNREDCVSTQKLRDWLESLRAELLAQRHDIPRPVPMDEKATEEISELDAKLQQLRDSLLEGVSPNPNARTDEQQARFILAHMMEFHRRESKASWWEYFRARDLAPEDYEDERRALVGLTWHETLDPGRSAPLERYRFPPQEVDVRRRENVHDPDGEKVGKVEDVNYTDRTIDIKKTQQFADDHPEVVFFHNYIGARQLQESLMRLGGSVLVQGFSDQPPYRAGLELLLRRPSPLRDASRELQRPGETTVQAACRLASNLEGHVLAIQGPPGTGKTYTGAKIICALKAQGLKVGVTAVSHKVIDNLLEGAMKEGRAQGIDLTMVHKQVGKYEGEWGIKYHNDYQKILPKFFNGEIDVLGGTAWCWAKPELAQSVDVLIVDEAGQMSLSNVLAASPGGKGIVLLGDPQQLEQPLQSSHPEGSEVSALYHLLDGQETMPASKGLFLSETYRLHPEIARFTSEVYYEGKVTARPELEHQAILMPPGGASALSGSGLRYVPVDHAGCSSRSDEEIDIIAAMIAELLDRASWRNHQQEIGDLSEGGILVVAPYNRQVAALNEAIPRLKGRIGTVDKFQGREAAIVIYSMTSSTPEDAPRGMDFLYDRHRFNVATSRARALCVLVGSPALFEPECRTPRQMRRANGFCRYLELAEVVAPSEIFG